MNNNQSNYALTNIEDFDPELAELHGRELRNEIENSSDCHEFLNSVRQLEAGLVTEDLLQDRYIQQAIAERHFCKELGIKYNLRSDFTVDIRIGDHAVGIHVVDDPNAPIRLQPDVDLDILVLVAADVKTRFMEFLGWVEKPSAQRDIRPNSLRPMEELVGMVQTVGLPDGERG